MSLKQLYSTLNSMIPNDKVFYENSISLIQKKVLSQQKHSDNKSKVLTRSCAKSSNSLSECLISCFNFALHLHLSKSQFDRQNETRSLAKNS